MIRRAIVALPDLSCGERIELVRRRYDPLAQVIPAHITLVFPFASGLSTRALAAHMRACLANSRPFQVNLAGLTAAQGQYLFLEVSDGREEVVRLHDSLYTGLLQPFLDRDKPYRPHITIGRFDREEELEAALEASRGCGESCHGRIERVVVERLQADDSITVELEFKLR